MKKRRRAVLAQHVLVTSEHPEGEKLPEAYATTIEEIARRAHAIYLSRLCASGHAIDDWLQAEREIASEGKPIDMPPS